MTTEKLRVAANFCSEYVDNFLSKEPIPGVKNELKYLKKLLPEIKLEDINALAKKWITEDNMALVVSAPEKDGVKVPTKEDILNVIKNSKTTKLEPYVDSFKDEPFLTETLKGSKVVATKEDKEVGFTELTLANGIQVILKPTDYKNDEILVSAYSPGGISLYPDKDYISAKFASTIIDQSGIGNFDNIQLEKKLKGKIVQVSPSISEIQEGITGSSTPNDFETLLQLTYLYFKSPRKDTSAFNTFISQTKNQLKFVKANPQYTFYDTLYKVAYPNASRMILIPTQEQLDKVNLDVLYNIYKDRFADASDFKFFFVGNFAVDTLIPMIEKYIGSLPATNRKETWKDVSPKFATGIKDIEVKKGTDPQSMVGILMSGDIDYNDKNFLGVRVLNEVLEIKLIEVIREEMSGVYSPQAQITMSKYPKADYDLMVMFGCGPKNANKLTKAVFKIMKNIQKNGPTQVDLDKAKETIIRERETNLKKNNYWLSKIQQSYFLGEDINQMMSFETRLKALTLDDIKTLAAKIFTFNDHYVRVVLVPEKK